MRASLFFVIGFCCNTLLQAQPTMPVFKKLHSLQGTWRMETKRGPLFESWTVINDSTLHGTSYRLNGTDTLVLERISLVSRQPGLFYIPVVQDQNNRQPVRFTMKSSDDNIILFENPEHDFPQRIVYTLPENDTLHAWIEGTINGQARKSDFHYKKVK